jgi:hypothetical protein
MDYQMKIKTTILLGVLSGTVLSGNVAYATYPGSPFSVSVTNLPSTQSISLPPDVAVTLAAINTADSVTTSASASGQTQFGLVGGQTPTAGSTDVLVLTGGVQFVSAYLVGTFSAGSIDMEVTNAASAAVSGNTALWIACPNASVTQPVTANAVVVLCNTAGYSAIRWRANSSFSGTVTPVVTTTGNYGK